MKKMEGAVHLFEALSGVDQELLERAERNGEGAHRTKEKRRTGRRDKIRKSERVLAAAACLAAAGIGLWAVSRVSFNAGSMPETAADRNAAVKAGEGQKKSAAEAELPEGAAQFAAEAARETEETLTQGTADMEKLQQEALQAERAVTLLSEQEARQVQLLGNYVPESVPEGYSFEEAYCSDDGQQLFVSFTKGMDYIEIFIRQDGGESVAFTDTDEPEAYDVHLYRMPYADTVPEEYRETFDWPVFKSSDLTQEVVEARLESYEDAGGTASPRGNFAVYYEEAQVLVDFRGCGEAESIWKLFEGLGK